MLEFFKKSMLTGVGLALKTWDEVEALGKELEEKGQMPQEEAKKFITELRKKYEETQAKLEQRVEKSVKEFLKKADIVTSEDLKGLKKEIRELKKLISSGASTEA
ncbi:MAG: phasin family protein [Deltaproteobacteria bacterium]|nr:phasin family protein [Deltaproteobacteria bacterium]MBW2612026.1 phasin family protein [Deltaproteobacteria bacterium]